MTGSSSPSTGSTIPSLAATIDAHSAIVGASNSVDSGRSIEYRFFIFVNKPHGDQRLPAELEEVVVATDPLDAEHLAPHRRQLALDRRRRGARSRS